MFSPRGFINKFQSKFNTENETRGVKVKGFKRVESTLYDSDESVRNAIVEILIYIVFLVVATVVANASHHLYMFYFNQTIERSFLERSSQTHFDSEVSFDQMVTAADWWIYLETNFLEELHGAFSQNSDNEEKKSEEGNNENKQPETEDKKPEEGNNKNKEQETVENKQEAGNNENKEPETSAYKSKRQNNEDIQKQKEKTDDDKKDDDKNGDGKKDDGKKDDDNDDETRVDAGAQHVDWNEEFKKNERLHHLYLRDNILLGPPRLRQIRVKEGSCQLHDAFQTYFNSCYAGYSKSIENYTKTYKKTEFFTMSNLKVNRLIGEVTTYYGAGYVQNLTFDFEENKKILKALKEDEWIDRGTRLVVLEFVLFNPNAFMCDNVKIIAEMLPVGGIVPSHQFQALKLHSIWTERDWGLYVAGGLFYTMSVGYTIVEIIQLQRYGPKKYFTSVWNILDIIVLVLTYLSLAYSIVHPLYLKKVMESAKANPGNFVSIDYICYWNLLFIDMMGICVFLVWIKIFKYISFNKTMMQFSTTLKRCAKDLFGFAIMFFIVFLAYAQLGVLIFGTSHPDFREFGISVITLMRMFLGDFEYQLIEEANHILGPIYFLTYVLFVFFILLNMFLAIINDTYGAVKTEVSKGHCNFGSYLARRFRRVFPFCFRKTPNRADDTVLLTEINTAPPLYPSTTSGITHQPSADHVHMSDSEVLREYFEELPESQQLIPTSDLPKENIALKRLINRIALLEEVLEQLISNMDVILKTVEAKKT